MRDRDPPDPPASAPGGTLRGLRRRWLVLAGSWLAVLIVGRLALASIWPPAARWSLYSAAVLAYLLSVLWGSLADNHRPGETELRASLGPATGVSLLRALATGLLAGFLSAPWPAGWLVWVPMALYTAIALGDLMDGYLARRLDQVTVLGARLDQEVDALSTLVVVLLAIAYDQLPPGFFLVGLARYAFVLGEWRLQLERRARHPLPPSRRRRLLAGLMMGFLSASLWPVVPPSGATLAGAVFAVPFLIGFLRDWLVVSGRIDPNAADYRETRRRLESMVFGRLPVLLRLGLAISVTWVVTARDDGVFPPPGWTTVLGRWGLDDPILAAAGLAVVCVVATAMVGVGVAARIGSFLLLCGLLVDVNVHGVEPGNAVVLVCGLGVLILGSGGFSVWSPEEPFLLADEG